MQTKPELTEVEHLLPFFGAMTLLAVSRRVPWVDLINSTACR